MDLKLDHENNRAIYGQSRITLSKRMSLSQIAAVYERDKHEQAIYIASVNPSKSKNAVGATEEAWKMVYRLRCNLGRLLVKVFCSELVPEDPNDEPASELLKRFAANAPTTLNRKRHSKTTL